MVLDFAREGEWISDAAFRERVAHYYELVRAGMDQQRACAAAVRLIDRKGRHEPEEQHE